MLLPACSLPVVSATTLHNNDCMLQQSVLMKARIVQLARSIDMTYVATMGTTCSGIRLPCPVHHTSQFSDQQACPEHGEPLVVVHLNEAYLQGRTAFFGPRSQP